MRILRRRFLKTMGAVAATAFTFPVILRGQMTTSAIQRKELDMEIKRVGTQASTKGPGDWFTGTVRIDPLFQARPEPCYKRAVQEESRLAFVALLTGAVG